MLTSSLLPCMFCHLQSHLAASAHRYSSPTLAFLDFYPDLSTPHFLDHPSLPVSSLLEIYSAIVAGMASIQPNLLGSSSNQRFRLSHSEQPFFHYVQHNSPSFPSISSTRSSNITIDPPAISHPYFPSPSYRPKYPNGLPLKVTHLGTDRGTFLSPLHYFLSQDTIFPLPCCHNRLPHHPTTVNNAPVLA